MSHPHEMVQVFIWMSCIYEQILKELTNECKECTYKKKKKKKKISKTRLFKYIENFTTKKEKFSDKKKSYIFLISVQNIDCGYSLEPPRRGGSNEYHNLCFCSEIRKIIYTSVKPSFTI